MSVNYKPVEQKPANKQWYLPGVATGLIITMKHLLKNLFNKKQGFIMGTAKIKFPSKIEILLNKHIQKYFIISFLKINLGRKELEERIVNSMQKEFKLNVRGKRKSTIIK